MYERKERVSRPALAQEPVGKQAEEACAKCYVLSCLFQLCYMLYLITMFSSLRLFWQGLHHHCLMIPYDTTLLITSYGLILTLLLYNIALSLVTYKRAHVVDN